MQDVKPTSDMNKAIERIVPMLPDTVKVTKAKRGWDITVNNYTVTKNKRKALALLVTMLWLDANWGGIKARVAWTGRIPLSLNGWEDHALRSLHLNPPQDKSAVKPRRGR